MKKTFKAVIRYQIDVETVEEGKKAIENILRLQGIQTNLKIEHIADERSDAQNRARWLFCDQMARLLNEHSLDMRAFISEGIDMPWSKDTFMDFIWRPTLKMLTGKKTTRKETTQDINQVYDVINRAVTQRTNGIVQVPSFPSVESKMDRSNY